jgi:enoyl-CoA hydratase/carnithine racemase
MDALVEYAGPADAGGPFARLTLNSPHNRNALSTALVSQLHQGLRDAAADPGVRAVVLGHTGGTFCAGADLGEASGGDPRGDRERGAAGRSGSPPSARGDRERGAAGRSGSPPSAFDMAAARARELTALLRAIVESPLPVIAAIDGHVRAGGFGLVGACDIAVAGPRSTFALTEARIGVAPAIISLTLLPKMSARAAARYYLTGATFGAPEAAEIGLVTMAADDVQAAVQKLVADVSRGSPQGLAASKALTTAAVLEGFDRDAEWLTEQSARLFVSEEAREGMLAFLQKRPPAWAPADGAAN